MAFCPYSLFFPLWTRSQADPPSIGRTGPRIRSGEVFGQLVLPAVFKTDVTE